MAPHLKAAGNISRAGLNRSASSSPRGRPLLLHGREGEGPGVQGARVALGEILDKKLPLPRRHAVVEGGHRDVDQDDVVPTGPCLVM